MMRREIPILLLLSFVLDFACNQTKSQQPVLAQSPPVKTKEIAASRVTKIVFVGQKQACKCTRDRIDKSWKALQNTIAGRKNTEIERVQLDVDETRGEELNTMRALIAAPGLYFFDADNNLVDMLQGEVEEYQIESVLNS